MRFLEDPPRPLFRRCFYESAKLIWRMIAIVFYRVRCMGVENYPKSDGVLICANHQSNLDPIMIGLCLPRHTNYLGKKSLFVFRPLGIILDWLDTIPIDRASTGIGGMKETFRRLKKNESVLIFPEGRRSGNGELNKFMPGFVALAKRIRCPIVPVAIEGAFDAWPRNRWLPLPGHIVVVIGKPIEHCELEGLPDEEVVRVLSDQIQDCLQQARQKRIP